MPLRVVMGITLVLFGWALFEIRPLIDPLK